MTRTTLRMLLLALVVSPALAMGCAEDTSTTETSVVDEAACGIVQCAVDENAADDYDVDGVVIDPDLGKADASERVEAALVDAIADGVLDVDDVRALFEAAGGRQSVGELEVIAAALQPETDAYEVTDEASAEAKVLARVANISEDDEVALLASGMSFEGTAVPAEVLEVLAQARLHGAEAYDVTEQDEDGEGIWTHYPSISPAEGNMAFAYTMITPQVLLDDMNDVDVEYNAIVGTETGTTASGQEYKRARYEVRHGGTGNVVAHYDEVYHPDLYARGSNGQKWASNMAILSDGTIHCLPAARRDINQRLILTNPAMARGQHLLFNGHITILNGVVTDVEISGRLSKLAAKGKARFIDPLPLLEAWGFELAPGLRVRFGNTGSGVPLQEDGVIKEAAPSIP